MLSHSLQGNLKGNFELSGRLFITLTQATGFFLKAWGGWKLFLYPEVAYLMGLISSFCEWLKNRVFNCQALCTGVPIVIVELIFICIGESEAKVISSL